MKNYPKISVVTVNYNGVQYLENTIKSILNQGYPNLEYIIIDGASSDDSLEIIKKYKDKLAYWISEKDSGMYDAIQKGFNHSTGEIMCWLNADDEFYEYTFFALAEMFNTFPQMNWLQGAHSHINDKNYIWQSYSARQFTKYDFFSGDYCWIQQESTFWRRSLWKKINGINTSLQYAGDFALWCNFFEYDKLWTTDIRLGKFRHTPNQLSKRHIDKYHTEAKTVLKEHQSINQSINQSKTAK